MFIIIRTALVAETTFWMIVNYIFQRHFISVTPKKHSPKLALSLLFFSFALL